jgi:hypothetical protein
MKLFIAATACTLALISAAAQFPDAPTGFDNKTNGLVDDATHQADQTKFEEVEQLSDGLGPIYNAQSSANATRVRLQEPLHRLRNYASATRGRTDTSAIRKSPLLTEPK